MTPTPKQQMRLRHLLRRLLAVIFGLALVGGLTTACSSDDSDNDANSSDNTHYPITVNTTSGDVTIPDQPERIVTFGTSATESVLATGIEPTAALLGDWEAELEYLQQYTEKMNRDESLGTGASSINFEQLAQLDPDIIIAPAWKSYTQDSVSGKLNEIAPTLFFDNQNSTGTWTTGFEQIAKAINQTSEASQFIEDFNGQVSETSQSINGIQGRSYTFGRPDDKGGIVLASSADEILQSIGLTPTEKQNDISGGAITLSPEEIREAESDFVIMSPAEGSNSAQLLKDNALFDSSLKEHIAWTKTADVVNAAGPLGMKWVIETLPEDIEKKCRIQEP